MNLADIHCHILPYVDDGAQDYDEALELLRMEAKQHVRHICLTPHLREGMFDSPNEKILRIGKELAKMGKEEEIPIRLHLSREYYFDKQTKELIKQKRVIPMGQGVKTLLIEFSYDAHFSEIVDACRYVKAYGMRPLIAHVERYHTIQNDPSHAKELAKLGALLQNNAEAILGNEDRSRKKLCEYLLSERLTSVIASDAHDVQYRIPELEKCAKYLSRKSGEDYTHALMYVNPINILKG